MGNYRVPQDVEADDKLLGPFSFRQFIYLMITSALIALSWGLSTIFIALAFIPAPLIIFFAALALPLRKDQPTETYLAAIINFWIRPKVRIWDPEGIENTIEIQAPKKKEEHLTKEISETEAIQNLGYLTHVVETEGWYAVNPQLVPSTNTRLVGDVLTEADTTQDMFGSYNPEAQNINRMIDEVSSMTKEQLLEKFKKQAAAVSVSPPKSAPQQSSLNQQQPVSTPVNPAIINLAHDDTLNVATIAKQANRIVKQSEDEVVISLR